MMKARREIVVKAAGGGGRTDGRAKSAGELCSGQLEVNCFPGPTFVLAAWMEET